MPFDLLSKSALDALHVGEVQTSKRGSKFCLIDFAGEQPLHTRLFRGRTNKVTLFAAANSEVRSDTAFCRHTPSVKRAPLRGPVEEAQHSWARAQ